MLSSIAIFQNSEKKRWQAKKQTKDNRAQRACVSIAGEEERGASSA